MDILGWAIETLEGDPILIAGDGDGVGGCCCCCSCNEGSGGCDDM